MINAFRNSQHSGLLCLDLATTWRMLKSSQDYQYNVSLNARINSTRNVSFLDELVCMHGCWRAAARQTLMTRSWHSCSHERSETRLAIGA